MTTTRPASKEGGGRTKVSEGRVTFYLFERGRSRPSKQHAWSRAARTVSGGPCSIRAMAVCSVRCAKRLGEQRRGAPGRALQGQLYWLLLVQPRVRLAELPLVVVVQGRRAGVPRHVLPHEGRRGERERESGEAVRGDPTFVRQKCPTDAPVHIGMLAWDPPLPGHPCGQYELAQSTSASPDICSLRAKSLGLTSTMSSWASDLLGHAGRALEAVSTATAKKDEPTSDHIRRCGRCLVAGDSLVESSPHTLSASGPGRTHYAQTLRIHDTPNAPSVVPTAHTDTPSRHRQTWSPKTSPTTILFLIEERRACPTLTRGAASHSPTRRASARAPAPSTSSCQSPRASPLPRAPSPARAVCAAL